MSDDILSEIDLHNYNISWPKVKRIAIRAIIRNKERYAFIQSKEYGEYKFPGGGMEQGENEIETLNREVMEETGLRILPNTIQYYGRTIERKMAQYEADSIFEQISEYYRCEVDLSYLGEQKLDEYEKKYGYQLVWRPLNTVYQEMKKIPNTERMPWLLRDMCIVEKLLRTRYKKSLMKSDL